MNYYTSNIPLPLAEKLKEKGMPINVGRITYCGEPMDITPTYAKVFDWFLSEKNLCVWFLPTWDSPSDLHLNYEYRITRTAIPFKEHTDDVSYSWHEAANAAIEKALELI